MRQLVPISALLVGMFALLAAGGLHSILIPIRGGLEGFSNYQIGFIGTGYALGFTAGCVLVPFVVRRAGHVRTFSALVALLAANILACALWADAWFWLALRIAAGFGFAGCYMIAESWLNERVSNAQRGFVFSVYAIVAQGGMMAGQFTLGAAAPSADTLFMVGAILYALAVVPTAISKAQSPAPLTRVKLDVKAIFLRSPVAFVGSILSGIISSAWSNFAPVYGQAVGLSNTAIASLLAIAMLGSVVLQLPIGRLSDMVDRRYAMVLVCIFGAALGTLLTALTLNGSFGYIFYAAIAAYGAAIYSIYAVVVAHGNDYADPDDFVETASGLLILYGAGTMIGPLMTAQLIDTLGSTGIFTTTTVAHAALGLYALYRTFRRPAPKDQQDFSQMPIGRAQTPETYALDPRAETDEPGGLPELPVIKVKPVDV